MTCVLKIVGFANGKPCPIAGMYLKHFNFEAARGRGHGTFTPDPRQAKKFPDTGVAMQFWCTQSRLRPYREDGQPNRPLTASTVEVEHVE